MRRGLLVLVLVLVALAYAPTLRGEFVYDDAWTVVGNRNLEGSRVLRAAFLEHFWSHASEDGRALSNMYRPLFTLCLAGEKAVFGLEPRGYRVALLGLHLLVTVLVFEWCAKRLSPGAAVFAALLFGLHPQRVSSVAWITGVVDPLMTACALGALLSRRFTLVAFALALLTKEPAIGLVPALVLAAESRWKRAAVAYGAIALSYLVLRTAVLGSFRVATSPLGVGDALLLAPVLLLHYAARFFAPVDLALGPALDPELGAPFFLGVAILLALVAIAVRIARDPEARVALAVAVGPFLPLLDARQLHRDFLVQDRYLYLPAVGLSWLIARGATRLADRFGVSGKMRYGLAGGLALVLAGLTAREALTWKTDEALFLASVNAAPTSATRQLARGLDRFKASKKLEGEARAVALDQARDAFERAVARDERLARAWGCLGVVRFARGDARGATVALERQLVLAPDDPDGLHWLARARVETHEPQLALEAARRLVATRPSDEAARAFLVRIESVAASTSSLEPRRP